MKEMTKFITNEIIEKEGFEKGIKSLLDTQKEIKEETEKYYIEKEGNEEEGIYHNEIAYATFQLEVISSILKLRKLREEKEHIKTLCDEIRTITDDLEKLI